MHWKLPKIGHLRSKMSSIFSGGSSLTPPHPAVKRLLALAKKPGKEKDANKTNESNVRTDVSDYFSSKVNENAFQ